MWLFFLSIALIFSFSSFNHGQTKQRDLTIEGKIYSFTWVENPEGKLTSNTIVIEGKNDTYFCDFKPEDIESLLGKISSDFLVEFQLYPGHKTLNPRYFQRNISFRVKLKNVTLDPNVKIKGKSYRGELVEIIAIPKSTKKPIRKQTKD